MKSSKSYHRYVDLDYQPDPQSDVLTWYRVERAAGSKLDDLAFLGAIAAESSTGTWIEVATDGRAATNVSGLVYHYDESAKTAGIAYPAALFEPGNVSQLLTVIAGNAFGLADLSALKLLDVSLPPEMVKAFRGPKFGLPGIFETLELTRHRPIIGAIVKPKCGLSAEDHAQVCFEAWAGLCESGGLDGVDMVKDDEALTSQAAWGSDFDRRVRLTLDACRRAEDVSGRKKIYVPHVTHGNAFEALRRAELVANLGGDACMVDYVIGGCSLLQTLRESDVGLIIHGHRTMFAALHRPSDFGIDYLVWAKLFRILGGDQMHAGTPKLGVMQAESAAVARVCAAARAPRVDGEGGLSQDFCGARAVAPICGAGLDPLTTEPLVARLGTDVIVFAGGGCHGHPDGTRAGAASLKASALAVSREQTYADYTTSLQPEMDAQVWEPLVAAQSFFGKFDKQSPNDAARENM